MRKLCIIAVGKSSELNFIKTANYRTGVVTDVYPGRGSKKTKEKFVIYEEYGNRPYKVSGVTIGYNIVKSGVIPQRGLLSEQMRGKLPEGKRQFI